MPRREQFFSGVQYPSHMQPSLPGLGEDRGTEQMPLFETHRAGPANLYTRFDTGDAMQWTDQPRDVALTDDEREILDPGEDGEWIEEATPLQSGEFFQFESPPESAERQWESNLEAFGRSKQEFEQGGRLLGHEAYPSQVRPDLRFEDLHPDADYGDRISYYTDEGTEVGRVEFHEDEWGPNVDYAEINPLYRGRGFTRPAMQEFGALVEDSGIIHAGGFTPAGAGAFKAKGIPDDRDLEVGFDDYLDKQVEHMVEDELPDRAADAFPDEDWDSEDAPWGVAEGLRRELTYDLSSDPYVREEAMEGFKSEMQELQHLAIHEGGGGKRKGEFMQGWKPQVKRGVQEKLI